MLPLTKQLSVVSGSLWSKTLQGARAQRIEMLLLHEFHARKFILPDKLTARDKAAQLAAAANTKKGGKGGKGKKGGAKAAAAEAEAAADGAEEVRVPQCYAASDYGTKAWFACSGGRHLRLISLATFSLLCFLLFVLIVLLCTAV